MIKAVIFDWAGTTVDYGSVAPVIAFQKAFKKFGIDVPATLIRQDMGMVKWDHIGKILAMSTVKTQWAEAQGGQATETDRQNIYDTFKDCLMAQLREETKLKPNVLAVFKYLQEHHIHVATTTGYAPEMMAVVQAGAAKLGYQPELVLTADDVAGQGRPSPAMIQKIMATLDIQEPSEVIKIGDTVVDIQEGKNAAVHTVGILEGSSLMGLFEDDYNALSFEAKAQRCLEVKAEFERAGAEFTITDIKELPQVIEGLNAESEVTNER